MALPDLSPFTSPHSTSPHNRRRWTQHEDSHLADQVQECLKSGSSVDWRKVAQGLANRSNKDCRKRWLKIDTKWNTGQWSKAEDEQLKKAVELHQARWKQVSDEVKTRNPDQCAKRWRNALDPSLHRGNWEPVDDEKLNLAVKLLGRDWKAIVADYFPSRSRLDLSNRHTMINRKKRIAHRRALSRTLTTNLMTQSPSSATSETSSSSGSSESSPSNEKSEELWHHPVDHHFTSINSAIHQIIPSDVPVTSHPMPTHPHHNHHQHPQDTQQHSYGDQSVKMGDWCTSSGSIGQSILIPVGDETMQPGIHDLALYPSYSWPTQEWTENKDEHVIPVQYDTSTMQHSPEEYHIEASQQICMDSEVLKDGGSPGRSKTVILDSMDDSTRSQIFDTLCKGKSKVSIVYDE
ncbi:hypothetical protein BT63DRAFT_459376 [Microthyrium microscopicum]|uniref:Uncharacterized protein n=1 Tax=Microthyrium microscopicum TaxID=703497 RepID=A0A6A6U0E7_9PEZI|nr:hypothetical protein BT63DRAFT_459376 [Microthyrium microscopicum]